MYAILSSSLYEVQLACAGSAHMSGHTAHMSYHTADMSVHTAYAYAAFTRYGKVQTEGVIA